MFRLLVLAILAGIVLSLGTALVHLARGRGEDPVRSAKLVRALTWRIALSVGLFALLVLAWRVGWIQPHGVRP
jgi:formate/nitrite transporter FocA (FNT family)